MACLSQGENEGRLELNPLLRPGIDSQGTPRWNKHFELTIPFWHVTCSNKECRFTGGVVKIRKGLGTWPQTPPDIISGCNMPACSKYFFLMADLMGRAVS